MEILRERPGMLTTLQDGVVTKTGSDDISIEGVRNSYRFLKALQDTPYVPKVYSLENNSITMEYIEETPVTDIEGVRRHAIQILYTIREYGVIHGDMSHVNFKIRNNIPVVYDWDQAVFAWEKKPQKAPLSDSYNFVINLVNMKLDPSRILRRWLVCREILDYYFGWATFADLGTHMGDFCGLASVERMRATGVDAEYIRPCIEEAKKLWGNMRNIQFFKQDIVEFANAQKGQIADVVLCFSTWPYLVEQHNLEYATEFLKTIIRKSSLLLFESQYYTDGPGNFVEFLKTDDDMYAFLKECGATNIERVGAVPSFPGRDIDRTIWGVR